MSQTGWITRSLEWLLDLEAIRLGRDAPLSIHWQLAIPVWLLVPLVALAVFVVLSVYRREPGGAAMRTVLATLRVLIVSIVVLMLCQPILQLQRNRREPSHVALLIDASQSMNLADQPTKTKTRLENLVEALLRSDAAPLRSLMAHNQLELFSFGGRVTREASAAAAEQIPMIVEALRRQTCDAVSTDVPAAVIDVLQRREGGRLAALVLATDGRSTLPGSVTDAIAAAAARQVPIHVIPIGSDTPRCDLAIGPISGSENVFLKDRVALRTRLEGSGIFANTPVTLRLIDVGTGQVIEVKSVELTPQRPNLSVEFRFKPDAVGRKNYRVEVDPIDEEITSENNSASARVNVIDEKLRVLYVEAYPRYEYRYLKNTLLRDPTIRCSCLLLGADRDFVQEGTDPIRRFPETLEELGVYDVVLFGDVDPRADWLSSAQVDLLVQYVADGGGFGVLAGPRFAPHAFRHTALAKLLPVRIDPDFLGTYTGPLLRPYNVQLTPAGKQHRIFAFLENTDDPGLFGGMYWIARTLGPKPGAEVLLGKPSDSGDGELMPVIVTGRYGAGRVFFSATDETWRWRRDQGEWVFDAFWLQVCRALAAPSGVGTDRRIALRADRSQYRYGERAVVTAEVADWELLTSLGDALEVLIRDSDEQPRGRMTLARLGSESRLYEGSFVPPSAGNFTLDIEGWSPAPGTQPLSTVIRVSPANLEYRDPRADLDALRRLAEGTGGQIMGLDEIAEKASAILDRSIQIPDDVSEPLWDSKLAIGVFVLLLITEWVMRKRAGLV